MREEYLELYEQIRTLAKDDKQAAIALAEQTSQQAAAADLSTLAAFFAGMTLRLQGKHSEAVSTFEPCLEDDGFPLPGELRFELGLAEQLQQHHDTAIEYYQQALAEDSYDTPGDACNNMGLAYYHNGDHDRAIECFEKALAEETFDRRGTAWSNMGLAYYHKGDYDRAIECYEKALAEETFDRGGTAWLNMGLAYDHKGDYDRAIECFEKALAEDSYDTPGSAWANMGNAYRSKSDYDQAIDRYMRAVDEPSFTGVFVGHAWYNMGLVYRDKGETDQARAAFENALYEYQMVRAEADAADARNMLDGLAKGQPVVAQEKQTLVGEADKEQDLFQPWATHGDSSGLDDVFVFLKDWSASSPYVTAIKPEYFQHQTICGGGYFLKWNGRGTVIDPGVSFVTTFLNQGFHPREMHHVLTTHAHLDHTADLMPLQNIFKEYCDAVRRDDQQCHPLVHFWDTSTLTVRPYIPTCDGEEEPHELTFRSTPVLPPQAAMEIAAIDSGHCPNSVALRFNLSRQHGEEPLRIGLSSDAAVDAVDDLVTLFHDCAIIIIHFSKAHEPDFITGELQENHLGYNGCMQIIRRTNAQLYIIAEFSAERGTDRRIADTKTIAQLSGKAGIVIPADIGLTVCLQGNEHEFTGIRCSKCHNFCAVSDIQIIPPQPFRRIEYFCSDCAF